MVVGMPAIEDFVGERFAAFDGETVIGALASEGNSAVGYGFERSQVTRIAALAFAAFADMEIGAQRLEPFDDARFGIGGDEDFEARAGCLAYDGRRQSCVTATCNGKGALERSGGKIEQNAKEVASFVRARDVVSFVFDKELLKRI